MNTEPTLSIVIITWNQADKLKACLESVFAQQSRHPVEVIVVVNGSTDHTRHVIRKFARVRSIFNPTNRGVATARNQGIHESRGRLIMMLDDDTFLREGCIEATVEAMDRYPNAWGGGTKTFTADGKLELNARTFYTVPAILFRRSPLGKWFPNASVLRQHLMADWDHETSRAVDWVSGASLVMKREAIESIGAFDESFFFGFEDVDWCYRARLAGKEIYYLAQASIVHHVQGTSRNPLSMNALRHLTSFFHFQRKHKLWRRAKSPAPSRVPTAA